MSRGINLVRNLIEKLLGQAAGRSIVLRDTAQHVNGRTFVKQGQ
jgi:hypothetical protein